MKLIMENWNRYQDDLLLEVQIWDAIKLGFKKIFKAPEAFNQLVMKAKQNFQTIMTAKLEELSNSQEIKSAAQSVAAAINQNAPAMIQENEPAAAMAQQEISLVDLKRMGVDESTLELIANSLTGTAAAAILEACEEAVGKPAPPRMRDFLMRLLKKSSKMMMFGFIDNFVMIIAGDMIDAHIGTTLGISTMAAAAFGNMTSDVAGEEAGSAIEAAMEKMGLDIEDVSDEQMEQAPGWMQFLDKRAGSFGVAIGCLLGMVPLAFKEEQEPKGYDRVNQ